jgi:hypothetical protein
MEHAVLNVRSIENADYAGGQEGTLLSLRSILQEGNYQVETFDQFTYLAKLQV